MNERILSFEGKRLLEHLEGITLPELIRRLTCGVKQIGYAVVMTNDSGRLELTLDISMDRDRILLVTPIVRVTMPVVAENGEDDF